MLDSVHEADSVKYWEVESLLDSLIAWAWKPESAEMHKILTSTRRLTIIKL